jgi:hypothetical protein
MKSKRIIVTIPEQDRLWLENYSRVRSIPVAEAVRRGIERLRREETPESYRSLLQSTSGLWKQGDGLEYQQRLREEWS